MDRRAFLALADMTALDAFRLALSEAELIEPKSATVLALIDALTDAIREQIDRGNKVRD